MSYPGSKGQAGTFQLIIGQMPPHEVYWETHLGEGKIFKTKRRADTNILTDLRQDLVEKFKGQDGVNAFCADATQALAKESKYFREPLYRGGAFGRVLIYCDPPYVHSTRQGRFYYDHEMTDAQHLELLAVLKTLKCNVLLSGYPSELYSSQLQDWRCISYRTRTRGRTLTECLWCNFPEPTELHDWRFAGKNYRERLLLKRLAARYLARLDAMPPRKRGYVLDAIHQRQNQR